MIYLVCIYSSMTYIHCWIRCCILFLITTCCQSMTCNLGKSIALLLIESCKKTVIFAQYSTGDHINEYTFIMPARKNAWGDIITWRVLCRPVKHFYPYIKSFLHQQGVQNKIHETPAIWSWSSVECVDEGRMSWYSRWWRETSRRERSDIRNPP